MRGKEHEGRGGGGIAEGKSWAKTPGEGSETRVPSLAAAHVDILGESNDLQAAVANNGADCQSAVLLLHDEVHVAIPTPQQQQ